MTGEDPTDVRSYLLDRRAFRDDSLGWLLAELVEFFAGEVEEGGA